ELIERIIRYCGDDQRTLWSFSITCHQLRPRSLCLMVADVTFRKRGDILAFRDLLRTHPHLCLLVQSLTTQLDTAAPLHFLHVLPNLSNITMCADGAEAKRCSISQPVLACYRTSMTC
ncbi:hypothetical protein BD309DRAFT_822618, partial [Dichomitus squalens]